MPHIKVKKISDEIFNSIEKRSSIVSFRADPLSGSDLLFGVAYQNEEFLLQIKREDELDMIKYDKVSRPLKVDLIKEALALLVDELELDVVTSNIAISHSKPALSSKFFKKIKDFESIEFDWESVAVEVGFGSGRHLLYQAQQNTDRLHIGIEIHTPSAQQLLKQIELQSLNNIWVVNYDARLFLEMLPSNLCSQIFVHFPVPWDKKPHRRVISSSFVSESLRVLSPNGKLELRTDSDNYFWYSMQVFFDLPKVEVVVVKNTELAITSKYEARWRRQEKDIYEVHLISKEFSDSNTLSDRIEFSFTDQRYLCSMETTLPNRAIVEDGYFVHFERIYKIGDSGLLIKSAFGSFDRPEHKYIVIDDSDCRYYPSTPIKTRVNYLAHQKIREYLTCPQIS